MEVPGQAQTPAASGKVWQVSVALRPGACTIVDWAASTMANDEDTDGASSQSDSDSSDDGGHTSTAGQLPPAIANDPFFAQLLRNSELHEASEKKKKKKKAGKRRAKETADDMYDLEDPFIDDSELTVMDGHNYSKTQRKKRRKRDDGSNTETEGAAGTAAAGDAEAGESAAPTMEDLDKYEEDDFFVYYGPLNELDDSAADEAAPAPAKSSRARKRPEKKPAAKDAGAGKKKASGAKGDVSDSGAKKKPDAKAQQQHRRSGSDLAGAGAQVPSNGRKSGARTSRKLDQGKSDQGKLEQSKSGSTVSAAGDEPKPKRPPIPDRDKPANGTAASGGKRPEAAPAAAAAGGRDERPASKRTGAPLSGAAVSSTTIAPDDSKALAAARQPTAAIEAALAELSQATQSEAFTNRQRFPSSLKPALRQVCELSMARALEHDRAILALSTPEHTVFAWAAALDIVGFTAGIYHRLAAILPYNRATVRKIVSKLLGHDLLTWKEQQLKQIEDGLKARVDEQIERSMGWIPVARAGDDAGAAQVRWHWTTLSKHILYQYMVLTLNINELRGALDPGKDGAREQQARKDAYAHLVGLWPGSSMSTYEISRAYSSRKSLLEKQSKRGDRPPDAAAAAAGLEAGARATPESAAPREASAAPAADVARQQTPTRAHLSPYIQIEHASSSPAHGEHVHVDYGEASVHASPAVPYDGGLPAQFAAHSHRALEFAAASPRPHAHGSPYAGEQQSFQHGPACPQHELQEQHQMPAEDSYSGSNDRYNSMSVRNLTSP
ncbi:hypothetical protein H4S02_005974 [Coemansia sp. RSA 2611]|nr:hypothetical protein H4S02_005974 [Coemansia sp. RSA 2611]